MRRPYIALYNLSKDQKLNKTETLPVVQGANHTGGSAIVDQGPTTTSLPMTEKEILDNISTTPKSDEISSNTATVGEDPSVLGLGAVYSENPDSSNSIYESNPKHDVSRVGVSPQPTNPEEALASSIPINGNTNSRISFDRSTGEIVVFQNHEGNKYHGYVVKWNELRQKQKNTLINAGIFKPNGKLK